MITTTSTELGPAQEAPPAAGAYSLSRKIGPFLQISGQLGTADGATTVAAQTRVALERVAAILEAVGGTWSEVLIVRAHLASDDLFDEFDAAYAELVPQPYPARVTVTAGLAPGALVEIDALAVLDTPWPEGSADYTKEGDK